MGWPFSLEMKVLFRDLDAMAHVNNAVYFTYLEQARTEYYFKMIGKTKVYDLDFIVASAKCDYKSSASIHDKVIVHVRPAKVGKTSWTFQYEIREKKSNRLIAEAETVQVAYDYKKGKKKKINPKLRHVLLEDSQGTA